MAEHCTWKSSAAMEKKRKYSVPKIIIFYKMCQLPKVSKEKQVSYGQNSTAILKIPSSAVLKLFLFFLTLHILEVKLHLAGGT